MVYIILFLATVLLLIGIVRVGAVALKTTGMEWDNAWFQALSAFTNTGFTTDKAEQINRNNKRRRVVIWLMILGNAGIATIVITLLKTLNIRMDDSFLQQGAYLIAIFIMLYILYLILSHRADTREFIRKIDNLIEKYFINAGVTRDKKWEKILHLKDGYGFARVLIDPESIFAGMTLSDSTLKQHLISVVAIERGDTFLPVPEGDEILRQGDLLFCYGKLSSIKKGFIRLTKDADITEDEDEELIDDDDKTGTE